jgi:ATP-dependent Clp protease ATP-binding subunit ClpA
MPLAARALAEAGSIARAMGHEVVGDHHLLMALMAADKGAAAEVLNRLGLTESRLRDAVLAMAPSQGIALEGPMGIDPDTKRLLGAAAAYAARHGSRKTGTEHLLVALAGESVPIRRLLTKLEVDPDLVSSTIEEELGRNSRT